jgi:pyruvate formate lyase activating enzyme
MSVEEVFLEVYKDFPFYRRSQGGMTLSGGEPLMQADFVRSLLRYCSRYNVHTAVETSGFASWETLSRTLAEADLVLFDFKHLHPLKHLKFTGVNNGLILENLKRLDAEGIPLLIRVPVVPGFNATVIEMQAMADFIASLIHPHPCHLLPYHSLARSKYRRLDMESRFYLVEEPSSELMREFSGIWRSRGLETQVGG